MNDMQKFSQILNLRFVKNSTGSARPGEARRIISPVRRNPGLGPFTDDSKQLLL